MNELEKLYILADGYGDRPSVREAIGDAAQSILSDNDVFVEFMLRSIRPVEQAA